MKTLSRYPVMGSLQALGVQFGYGEWWTGIESLRGLPVLIRVFAVLKSLHKAGASLPVRMPGAQVLLA
jgi:hypothetical protein